MNNNFNIPYTPIEFFKEQRLTKIKKKYKIKGRRKLKYIGIEYQKNKSVIYEKHVSEPWFSLIKQ